MDEKEKDSIERSIDFWKGAKVQAQGQIAAADAIIADYQSQLESEPEPLKHGDYGFAKPSAFFLYAMRKKQLELFGENKGSGRVMDEPFDGHVKLGNIFTDLQALQEPIEEFTIGMPQLRIKPFQNIQIEFWIKGGELTTLSIKEAEEIHRKLGALIYQLKKEQ